VWEVMILHSCCSLSVYDSGAPYTEICSGWRDAQALVSKGSHTAGNA
jgi:hypothetical protein